MLPVTMAFVSSLTRNGCIFQHQSPSRKTAGCICFKSAAQVALFPAPMVPLTKSSRFCAAPISEAGGKMLCQHLPAIVVLFQHIRSAFQRFHIDGGIVDLSLLGVYRNGDLFPARVVGKKLCIFSPGIAARIDAGPMIPFRDVDRVQRMDAVAALRTVPRQPLIAKPHRNSRATQQGRKQHGLCIADSFPGSAGLRRPCG